MELYLMRHGEALTKSQARVEDDAQRPLAPQGLEVVRRVAAGLQSMGVVPSLILTSPLLRATQTASCVADVLRCPERVKICDTLGTSHDPDDVQETLRHLAPGSVVLAIGHQPLLGRLALWLVFGDAAQEGLSLPPAGVCALWLPDQPQAGHAVIRGVWDAELFLSTRRGS